MLEVRLLAEPLVVTSRNRFFIVDHVILVDPCNEWCICYREQDWTDKQTDHTEG